MRNTYCPATKTNLTFQVWAPSTATRLSSLFQVVDHHHAIDESLSYKCYPLATSGLRMGVRRSVLLETWMLRVSTTGSLMVWIRRKHARGPFRFINKSREGETASFDAPGIVDRLFGSLSQQSRHKFHNASWSLTLFRQAGFIGKAPAQIWVATSSSGTVWYGIFLLSISCE